MDVEKQPVKAESGQLPGPEVTLKREETEQGSCPAKAEEKSASPTRPHPQIVMENPVKDSLGNGLDEAQPKLELEDQDRSYKKQVRPYFSVKASEARRTGFLEECHCPIIRGARRDRVQADQKR